MEQQELTEARFPARLRFLFKPARYKVLYGGRGGAKSWGIARALLIQGMNEKLLILCTRELQNSIEDSVHKILSEQIKALGFESFYKVQATSIIGANGTEFIFKGLKMNINSIKSFEGVDRVWVEEAQTVSKASWDTLIPTIRKEYADGTTSEIWISFNPLLETDETYKRFVLNPPSNAVVKKILWQDNPYFPQVLRHEMEDLKTKDYDAWMNVWEGHCRQMLDGVVYAKEIREATTGGRITKVPYDPSKPVHTFWDMGWSDSTAIWFAQAIGFEYRVIEYVEGNQRTIPEWVKILQSKPYTYGIDYMPHDAAAKALAAGGRSMEQMMRTLGRTVKIVPKLSVADGINAARTIFANCYFDEEKCADGLTCLRHYRYEVDKETGQFSRNPVHDHYSHGADGFRMLGVSLREKKDVPDIWKQKQVKTIQLPMQTGGWMGS